MRNAFKNASSMVALGALALGMLILGGCNSGPPEFKGTVTWNGAPIEDGYIEFAPTDGNGQLTGTDIIDGKYLLRMVPGSKKVSIRAKRQVGMKPANERMPAEAIMHQYIPAEFNSATTLKKVFDSAESEVNIDIEGQEIEYVPMEMPKGRKDNY